MKHKIRVYENGAIPRCCVLHFSFDGKQLEQCYECDTCGDYIRPEELNEECCGKFLHERFPKN
jgi:hypothetical protein